VTLEQRLREYGLYLRGITRLNPDELESYGFPVDRAAIALVGNIGSSYWPLFSESPEYDDGAADPLDRWSRRVAETVAAEFSLQPVYPFEGPPYYPFQRWAQRAEALEQSPIGVMMHPEFGLWHSYRFARQTLPATLPGGRLRRQRLRRRGLRRLPASNAAGGMSRTRLPGALCLPGGPRVTLCPGTGQVSPAGFSR
jgi:hypothetical protein